ncbi:MULTISPECIES: hypothetical protein [unclassified Agrococcus]|uniref:hypothetical protein n=1 Tax=unclassified Agrococcus TaxID=2615065 RepID=UPI003618EF75
MSPLERRLRDLLRWYPRSWRDEHGEVMVAMLLDDAEARGLAQPTGADAWSMRMHGVAAHASAASAAAFAALALVAILGASALGLADPTGGPAVPIPTGSEAFVPVGVAHLVAQVLTLAIAAPLVVWSALSLAGARRSGYAPALLLAAAAASILGGALAVASIAASLYPTVVRHGDGSSSASPAMPSWILGLVVLLAAACAVPLVGGWLEGRVGAPWRWPLALLGAATLAAGAVAMAMTTLDALAAVVLLLLSFARLGSTAVAQPARPSWSPRLVGALGGVSLVLGAPTSVFLLLAAGGLVPVDDGGMRLVGALAAAASVPAIVAGATMVRTAVGRWAWAPAVTLVAAVLAASVAVALDPSALAHVGSAVVSAACAGAACAAAVVLLLRSTPWRVPAALATGCVATLMLLQPATWLAPVAWVAGVPILIAALVRARSDARAAADAASREPALDRSRG